MNPTLNLALVCVVPLLVTSSVAVVRWVVDRDVAMLASRLRRWGSWAVLGSYAVFATVMTLSMTFHGASADAAAGLASLLLFAGVPLATWAWLRAGGRGLPTTMALAVVTLCVVAVAAAVDPEPWWQAQNGGFPVVSVLALAVGASLAGWGRRAPLPAGVDLLVLGTVPLGIALVAPAAVQVLQAMFAPMPMFALVGVVYLVAARLARVGAERSTTPTHSRPGRAVVA